MPLTDTFYGLIDGPSPFSGEVELRGFIDELRGSRAASSHAGQFELHQARRALAALQGKVQAGISKPVQLELPI
jgi:hypothetical protein